MDKKESNYREVMSTRELRIYVVHGTWDIIVLFHENRHLSTRFRIDGIKAMSRGNSGCEPVIRSTNRPFARWRHFTATTRILQGFSKYVRKNEMNFGLNSKKPSLCKWPVRVIVIELFILSKRDDNLIVMQNVQCQFRQVSRHYCLLWG